MKRPKERSWLSPWVSVVAVALSVAWFPSMALAANDAPAAKARYEAGVRHFDLSEYEAALVDFKEAYRNKPDPALLYNIAQCHRRLGHTEEAITFYRSYLRRASDAKNRQEVERRISELETIRDAESAAMFNSNDGKTVSAEAQHQPPPVPAEAQHQPSPVSAEAQQKAVAETATAVPATAMDLGARDEPAPQTTGPIYKRWWFWTALGAVAVGTATVAIIMAERDPTKIPASALGAQKVLP
jgi:tetratricopeptide (TPR) repeat protein